MGNEEAANDGLKQVVKGLEQMDRFAKACILRKRGVGPGFVGTSLANHLSRLFAVPFRLPSYRYVTIRPLLPAVDI